MGSHWPPPPWRRWLRPLPERGSKYVFFIWDSHLVDRVENPLLRELFAWKHDSSSKENSRASLFSSKECQDFFRRSAQRPHAHPIYQWLADVEIVERDWLMTFYGRCTQPGESISDNDWETGDPNVRLTGSNFILTMQHHYRPNVKILNYGARRATPKAYL